MDIHQKVDIQGSLMNTKFLLATLVMHQTQVLGDASKIIQWNNIPQKSKMFKSFFHINKYTLSLLYKHLIYMQQRLISVSLMGGRRSNDTVGTRLLYSLARYITMSINCDDLDICIINFRGIIIKLYCKCQSAEGGLTAKSMGKVY